MKHKITATTKSRGTGVAAAIIVSLLMVVAIVLWSSHSRSKTVSTTVIKPTTSATPTPNTGVSGDEAKSQYSSSPATAAPKPSTTALPTPASTQSNSSINSFTVTTRSDGFHVASILSNVTSGSCQVSISPTGSATVTQSGQIILSGTTYMCDFGGDIAGSGSTGSAKLVVTPTNSPAQTQTVSF